MALALVAQTSFFEGGGITCSDNLLLLAMLYGVVVVVVLLVCFVFRSGRGLAPDATAASRWKKRMVLFTVVYAVAGTFLLLESSACSG